MSKVCKEREKLLPGAVIVEPGCSERTETGSWRSQRPVVDEKKCTGCLICWMYCPDIAIKKGKPVKIDYRYCKGCGICADVCPFKAIIMEQEGEK